MLRQKNTNDARVIRILEFQAIYKIVVHYYCLRNKWHVLYYGMS